MRTSRRLGLAVGLCSFAALAAGSAVAGRWLALAALFVGAAAGLAAGVELRGSGPAAGTPAPVRTPPELCLATVDGEGTVSALGSGAGALLGLDAASAGTSLLDLVHPDDRRLVVALVADAEAEGAGRSPSQGCRLRDRDGGWRRLELRAEALSGVAGSGALLTARPAPAGSTSGSGPDLEGDLRRALDDGDLELVYQPVADLSSGALAGFLAEPSWRHRSAGALPPAMTAELADRGGFGVELAAWAAGRAGEDLERWSGLPDAGRVWVTFPVSGGAVSDPRLPARLGEALAGHDRGRLLLAAPAGPALTVAAQPALGRLPRGLGLALQLTGADPAAVPPDRLGNLPVRLLITGHDHVPAAAPLAAVAGAALCATGVGDSDTLSPLLRLGCDGACGPFFSRPVRADEVEVLLGMHARASVGAA